MLTLAKNVEIFNRQLANFNEAICNGFRQALECLIVEENIQYNLQYHRKIVEIIYSFGGKIERPMCTRT